MHWIFLDAKTAINLAQFAEIKFWEGQGKLHASAWNHAGDLAFDFHGHDAEVLMHYVNHQAVRNFVPMEEHTNAG